MFAALFLACSICFQYSLISQTVTYHLWVTPLLVTHKSRKLFCVSGCNCSGIPQWTGWEHCQSQPKLCCQNKFMIDCQNLFKICRAYLQRGFLFPWSPFLPLPTSSPSRFLNPQLVFSFPYLLEQLLTSLQGVMLQSQIGLKLANDKCQL